MKDTKLDFSKGVKGKFYTPENEIELPIYLDPKNQSFYISLARKQNISLSKLINKVLSKDREILTIADSKLSSTSD